MSREDIVFRYIFGADRENSLSVCRLHALKELMLEMVGNDFNQKCQRCSAHEHCYAPVSGVGSVESPVVFIGRNPGKDEDKQGLPFVGRGGQLLDNFIKWVGLDRNKIYVTNLVKCFTEGNRVPSHEEISTCVTSWLIAEFVNLRPRLIITLGAEACQVMQSKPLGDARFKLLTYGDDTPLPGVRVVSCIHPGSVLHNYGMMKQFQNDATYVRKVCQDLEIVTKDVISELPIMGSSHLALLES